jgi:hypothetical protein
MHLLLRVLDVTPHRFSLAALHNAFYWCIANLLLLGLVGCLGLNNVPVFVANAPLLPLENVPLVILSVFITYDSLRFALKVTASVAKLRELGGYDLFLLVPNGELTSVLNICRAYRFRLDGALVGFRALLVLAVVSVGLMLLTASSGSPSAVSGIVVITAWVVLPGLARCVDYLQSFTAASLIALLASQRENRGEAQAWVVGGFLGTQLALYAVFGILLSGLSLFPSSNGSLLRFVSDVYDWGVIAPLIFVLMRELINALLWHAVRQRLAD